MPLGRRHHRAQRGTHQPRGLRRRPARCKHHRNLPLLRRAVLERPDHAHSWQQLAETLAALGEPQQAIAACRRAVAIARTTAEPARDRVDGSLANQTLARILEEQGQDPLPAIEEGLAVFPDDRALAFMRARAMVRAGRDGEALVVLDGLLATDAETFHHPIMAYDKRIFSEFAHDLRGAALLHLGRGEEAAAAFVAAAAAAPDNLAYRAKAAAARGHAARARGHGQAPCAPSD